MISCVRGALFVMILLASGTVAWPVRAADVYVAFDAQGVAQFAEQPLDGRYQLLFKDLRPAMIGKATVASAPASLRAELERAAARHGLDYALLHAVVQAESGFNPAAVSPKGAIGLMQLMPDTARRYGVNADDTATLAARLRLAPVNVEAGSRYLSDLLRRYDGDIALALAAYNAGEGAVQRAGNRIPDYPETRHYVRKVMAALAPATVPAASAATAPRRSLTTTASSHGHTGRRAQAGVTTVQVYRGESSEIERFERGFDRTAASP